MLNALIVAPEITKGMKSIGSKALLKLKSSTTIIEYQIQELKKIDKKVNITIVTGFESEKIKKILQKQNKLNILYNDNYLNTNQAKCVDIFLKNYDVENLLIISNGVLFKNSVFNISDIDRSKIFLIDKPKTNFNIGCCDTGSNENIDYLFYDLPILWSECVFLNNIAIKKIREIFKSNTIDQLYIFELINILIHNNLDIQKVYIPKKHIMKINTIKDLSRAKTFI